MKRKSLLKVVVCSLILVILLLYPLSKVFGQAYPAGGGFSPAGAAEQASQHQALLQEARTNSTKAYVVAERYYKGRRVAPNPATGLAYLKHAANMAGDTNYVARYDLGVATYWGLGVKPDKEEGLKLMHEACAGLRITETNEVAEVIGEGTRGKPFYPVGSNGRLIYYEKQNRGKTSTSAATSKKE